MKNILTIISICFLALASCSGPYEADYDFGFDRQELRFQSKYTASYFMVYGEGEWTLRLDKDVAWVTLDKMNGSGTSQINVRLSVNEGVAREVTVIAEFADGSQKRLIISQEAASSNDKAYSLAENEYNLLKIARSLTIPATAKFIPESLFELEYWVEYQSEEDKDWIENLQFNYSDITFDVKENTSATDRSARICWTFPVANWENQDTLSVKVSQNQNMPSFELKESYSLDPKGLDTLKISPIINWDPEIYDFDMSTFTVGEGVTANYVKSANYLALIAGRNTTGQERDFTLEWSVMENGSEVTRYSTDLIQANFDVAISLEDSYKLDPAGRDTLKIVPGINWDPEIFDFDLSNFTVSEGVTAEYVRSGNYLALITDANTSGLARNFTLEWSLMDNGSEVAKYTTELVQDTYVLTLTLENSYNLDPAGLDTLKIHPGINWDPALFDFDLSNFTVSDGVTASYVKSGNYLALIAEANTSRQKRSFDLVWSVMDKGVEVTNANTTLVQDYYIPPFNLTPNGEYANSYILTDVEENYYSIDVYLVLGGRPAEDIVSASVLWQTSEGLITNCSYDALTNKLYVSKAKNAKGNAVVALKNGSGVIRWSYHFWMTNTDADIPEITVGGHVFMDRNLGAMTNTAPVGLESDATGLYYQWGRKDPFPAPQELKPSNGQISMAKVYPDGAVTTQVQQNGVSFETSVMNPNIYYWGSHNKGAQDWCSTPYEQLWSTSEKTDSDPCPYGYVVPNKSQMETFVSKISSTKKANYGFVIVDDNNQESYFSKGGYFRRKTAATDFAHVGQEPHCWTTGTGVNTETSGDAQNETNKDYNGSYATGATSGKNVVVYARRWGCNVRCVKETK